MINIQNIDDNECFKWYFVRYLDPPDHNPARITKADKDFTKKLDFKDIKSPAKIRAIRRKQGKTSNLCIKKYCEENHVDLLIGE